MTDVKLPGNITFEKLQQKTPKERHRIFENITHSRLFSEEDKSRYLELVMESGPIDGDTALTLDNPFMQRMYEIIHSPAGRAACVAATEQGLPALAGVEPLLVAELGEDYARTYMATPSAGGFVGMLMRELNYVLSGRKDMPAGSVAKRAATWQKRR
jgi:hypothetical protein